MANEKYIKVTPRGETESRVILASLRSFYISQGAKIETPTQAEIAAEFPEERRVASAYKQRTEDERHAAEIAQWKENATKQAERIKALTDENNSLNEKVASLEASLAETEQLVARLKEEHKPAKRASRYDKDE